MDNKQIILKKRPEGNPEEANFEIQAIKTPEVEEGALLLKSVYISVDPYLRGRMRDEKSYIPPFEIGKPIESSVIAEVLASNNSEYNKGDYVHGMLPWKLIQVHSGNELQKVDKEQAPLSAYLGILGLTGITAYVGLNKIGDLKKGETLLVSGASGAVGSTVGQIGKIKGCHVVGIAGSDEKLTIMKEKFGFHSGINYKTTKDMNSAVKNACPEGVDVYFDNVGGEILDAALANINRYGRVINCGAISLYNATETPKGPRHETTLVKKSVKMQGFIVRDFKDDFESATKQLGSWLQSGELTYSETIKNGFDTLPSAFIGLFEGENKGKMVVKV
ncbi:NADP-dependent oxidoreductase [Jejudonia soesokkakensis]|uniref:NADP-dependent oxidoreductase n=1 Tax=Jejudonia soesokkakensis TaxID=1323432 RepID=A0ABW2MS38_9FLAO